jgi:transposase-like protein
MSEIKKRTVHSPEFKAKVAMEALRGLKTLNEIGQEYGVHPKMVGDWKLELQKDAKTLFEAKRGKKRASEEPELERLYSEIGKLKMSLDWLQKKSGLSVLR